MTGCPGFDFGVSNHCPTICELDSVALKPEASKYKHKDAEWRLYNHIELPQIKPNRALKRADIYSRCHDSKIYSHPTAVAATPASHRRSNSSYKYFSVEDLPGVRFKFKYQCCWRHLRMYSTGSQLPIGTCIPEKKERS